MSTPQDKEKNEPQALCKLNKRMVLSFSSRAFIIKERVKTKDGPVWVNKWYYSTLGDAVRGYAVHALRDKRLSKMLDGSFQDLIDCIQKFEKHLDDICIKVLDAWDTRMEDPIEKKLMGSGVNA
jgi:hypothetical protein